MRVLRLATAGIAALLVCAGAAWAQPFSSGSTGSDGALTYTTPGTYSMDPAALNLNPAGDNIFNFTTITIASGVTLRLDSGNLRGKPVIWLATGNVTIAGTLDLSGINAPNLGSLGADWISQRLPTSPGAGGFPGGVGARPGTASYAGSGPGGGPANVAGSNSCKNLQSNPASFGTAGGTGFGGQPGSTYGNVQLVPLIGGSGGAGGCVPTTATASDASGGTGGAGGGAIRIVSSTSISLTGSIDAHGGTGGGGRSGGGSGAGGSGGAINLIAPVVTGTGSMRTNGGGPGVAAGAGYVLINAGTNTYTGFDSDGILTLRPLLAPPLPTPSTQPTIMVTSVNGVNVNQPAKGLFLSPDVTINATGAVTIAITATGIPVGTVVTFNIVSELGADQNIACTPLAGTLASSTATCSASFPTSVSIMLGSASWGG
jgi:hypothetical protein